MISAKKENHIATQDSSKASKPEYSSQVHLASLGLEQTEQALTQAPSSQMQALRCPDAKALPDGEKPPASKSVDSTTLQGTCGSICLLTVPLWMFGHCTDHALNLKTREWDAIQSSQSHTLISETQPQGCCRLKAQRRQQNNCEHLSSLCLGTFFSLL